MANLSTGAIFLRTSSMIDISILLILGNSIYLCHFCSKEFPTRATLFNHFSQCQIKSSTKQLHETIPSLTRYQLDILLS